jgi:hypothetical protein
VDNEETRENSELGKVAVRMVSPSQWRVSRVKDHGIVVGGPSHRAERASLLFPAEDKGQWTLDLARRRILSSVVGSQGLTLGSFSRRGCGRGWHSERLAVVSGKFGKRKSSRNTQGHAFAGLENKPGPRQIAEPRDRSGNSRMPMPKMDDCFFSNGDGSTYRGTRARPVSAQA